MSAVDNTWLDARIAKTKELIEKYEDAILALESSPDSYTSYTIETAQTRETVTRTDLGRLRSALASLENRLATLDARRHGGSRIARPGY